MKSFLAFLSAASVALALPNGYPPPPPPPPKCHIEWELAQFDDVAASPALELAPIPIPYNGLYYEGFELQTVTTTPVTPAVVPHSRTQYAVSNTLINTFQGVTKLTTDYPESKVKSFCLKSFYYGCGIDNTSGAGTAPVGCNIAVSAWKKGDQTAQEVQVGAQVFTYNPTSRLGSQQMAFGQFSSVFTDIEYVIIQYTLADASLGVAGSTLALFIDDVKYSICDTGNWVD